VDRSGVSLGMRVSVAFFVFVAFLCCNGRAEEVVSAPEDGDPILLKPFPAWSQQSFFDATDTAKASPWRHVRVRDLEVLSSCRDRTTRAFVEDLWRQRALLSRALPPSMRDEARPILLFLYATAVTDAPASYLRHGPNVVDSFGGDVGRFRVRMANLANYEERLALRDRGADAGLVEAIDCPLALRCGVDNASAADVARWWWSGRIAFSLDLVFSSEGIRCRWPPRIDGSGRAPYGENPPLSEDRRMLPLHEVISGLPPYENDDRAYRLTVGLFMRWAILADGGEHMPGVERLSRRAATAVPTSEDFAHDVGVDLAVVELSLAKMLETEGAGFKGLLAEPQRGDEPPSLRLRDATDKELRRFKQAVDEVGRRVPQV